MALKNKDGSPYVLRGPNPLVKDQLTWNMGDIIFHNFKWEFVGKPKKVDRPKPPPPLPKPEVKVIEQVVQEEKPQKANRNKIVMHCLPAVVRTQVDELYGDVYTQTSYAEKFTMEGIVLSREGYQSCFWVGLKLEIGSILYPVRYVTGKPFDDWCWWKVTEVQPENGGYVVCGIPSEFQPDFS